MQAGSASQHSLDAAATVTKVFDESDRSWRAAHPKRVASHDREQLIDAGRYVCEPFKARDGPIVR